MTFTKLTLVGAGNVAFHLAEKLSKTGLNTSLYARNKNEAHAIGKKFQLEVIDELEQIDRECLVLVCVSDQATPEVVNQLSASHFVAYTAGTLALSHVSTSKQVGVFYPLQSFTKDVPLSQNNFPLLIEANDSDFENELVRIAQLISPTVHIMNSEQRKQIHLSAVFLNNFSNHLWHLAKLQLDAAQLDWKILFPLLEESLNKLRLMDPFDAQTGPARRKDHVTISKHLEQLSGMDKEIYLLLTQSILKSYANEL